MATQLKSVMLHAFFIFTVLSCYAFAQVTAPQTVDGLGAPSDGLVSTGRALAIDDALRTAVQQGIGTYLSAETVVENFELIQDRIITKAAGFARLEEILEEGFTEDDLYRVLGVIIVSDDVLSNDLRTIIHENGNPRIVISAKATGDGLPPTPQVIAQLQRELVALGYSVLASANEQPNFANPEDVARFSLRLGADLALLVDIQSTLNSNPPAVISNAGLVSASTRISLSLVDMLERQVIYSESQAMPGAGGNIDSAIQLAIENLLPDLVRSLSSELSSWLQGAGQASKAFQLSVQEVATYSEIGTLMDSLAQDSLVVSLTLENFADGQALIRIDYRGSREGLIASLINNGWTISRVNDREIGIE